MISNYHAICKNTFISFDNSDASPRHPRSRSAESTRCRPEAEELEDLSQQSLLRLNAVLSIGMSSPLASPLRTPFASRKGSEISLLALEEQALKEEESCGDSPNGTVALSELRELQGKLAKALAGSGGLRSGTQKPWERVTSNCSLSTMDSDNCSVSECGELPANSPVRMPHAWSSGSICSMVSDFSIPEEDEFEFELDIEAGAEAARRGSQSQKQGTKTVPPSTDDGSARETEAQVDRKAIEPGKTSVEMSHGQVPRNQNLEEMYNASKDEPITTMMIRNIPGRYSQNDLMLDIKELGLGGTYDFLYLPMDKGTAANVGYAFVNFVTPEWARKCQECFQNFKFCRHHRSGNKVARVSVAHLQGLEKNFKHYENSAVNMSKEKRRRPVVVANISSEISLDKLIA